VNELSDQQLLRDYAEQRSEAAFAELVRRHVDLIYSAALRMVCDAHLADDVTQSTFMALAQNARQLTNRTVLSGWLHRTAQNLAAKVVRTDVRRRAREQEAAAMNELLSAGSDVSWEHIAPHLDAALGELNEPDRDAVLLRYVEKKSAQEMAERLGISDEAAQKRVSRAVERLREFFAKRGVTIGASGLVVIAANAVQAAPVGLALTISTAAALAGTTIATTATATATKAIAMTTLQKTLVAAAVAALAVVGAYEALLVSRLREQNQTLRLQQAPLAEQIQQLQRERDGAANRLSTLADEIQRVKGNSTELLKLRGEVGVLRQQAALDAAKTKSPGEAVAKVMNDSSAIELARVQTRQALKYRYTPLTQKLNLSPEATDKLFNLIIENELKKKVVLAQLLSGDMDAETAFQSRDNAKTELESQIAALLGDSGYAQFDQFNHDTAAGELVKGLNRELGDKALNDDQSKRIQELFGAKPDIIMDDMDLFRSKESLDALFQTLVDRGHHDLQEAASFLTPEQLATAYAIQSNYFNTIRNQMTLGQQLISKTKKQSK
jgi:RNA polymerase sigma factor (sigma-70 family)